MSATPYEFMSACWDNDMVCVAMPDVRFPNGDMVFFYQRILDAAGIPADRRAAHFFSPSAGIRACAHIGLAIGAHRFASRVLDQAGT